MRVPGALTLGEKLFEQACANKAIYCGRVKVATVQGHRRPDYKVRITDCGAIVEVKQIDPNDTDRHCDRELDAGRLALRSHMPGARLREAIRRSADQLRRVSQHGVPTAVAIFDTTGSVSYTDPYNVKVAMYGLDAIVIAVPEDSGTPPYRIGVKRAGKAVLALQLRSSAMRGFGGGLMGASPE